MGSQSSKHHNKDSSPGLVVKKPTHDRKVPGSIPTRVENIDFDITVCLMDVVE